jgi:outer membrane receptor protein involved in Fe transport
MPSGAVIRLVARAAGFAPSEQIWKPGDSAHLALVLRPAPLLERVTITATRLPARVGDTAASVTVLSHPDLTGAAALPIDARLRAVPGFMLFRRTDSRTANPTTQGVSLRGVGASGASRALVLYDGVPLNDPFGGWVYWDRIPPLSVDSVEVLEGGASDLYGSSALGGVINVIRRPPHDSALSFDASFGTHRSADASLAGTLRLGQWIASASGGAFRTDGYFPVRDAERGTVDTRASSRHAQSEFRLERPVRESLRVHAATSYLKESRLNGTLRQTNQTRLRGLVAGANWQSNAVGVVTLRVFGGPQTYDQTFTAIAPDRSSELLTRLQRVPAQDAGFSVVWSRAVGMRQAIAAGTEGRQMRGASDEIGFAAGVPTGSTGAGGRQRIGGAFLQATTRPSERWMVQAQLRGDAWRNAAGYRNTLPLAAGGVLQAVGFADRGEHAWSPRLSILRRLDDRVAVSGSVYRAFRAPTLNELYRSFRVGNVVTQSNAELAAERLTGGEAGVSAGTTGGRLSGRVAFFWAQISSPIANVTLSVQPTLITRQRQNLGATRSRGIGLQWEARPSGAIILSGGYQFSDARVLRFPADASLEGLWIPHVPRHVLTFQARSARARQFVAALQCRIVGLEYDDDQNLLRLKGFTELNATVSRPLGRAVEIYAAAENLLDVRSEVSRTPVTTLGPPLMLRGGIRFSWH